MVFINIMNKLHSRYVLIYMYITNVYKYTIQGHNHNGCIYIYVERKLIQFVYTSNFLTLIIMWYQRVCNCRQYCFGLVRPHQRDYSEQLWFPLNEIHQPQLLRVNRGKPSLLNKELMSRAGVIKPPKSLKPTARHHMTLIITWCMF